MPIWKGIQNKIQCFSFCPVKVSPDFKGVSLEQFKSQEAAGIYYQTESDPELCYNSAVVRDPIFVTFSETYTGTHTYIDTPNFNSLGSWLVF